MQEKDMARPCRAKAQNKLIPVLTSEGCGLEKENKRRGREQEQSDESDRLDDQLQRVTTSESEPRGLD